MRARCAFVDALRDTVAEGTPPRPASLPDTAPPARAIGYGVRLSEQEYTVRAARPAEALAILDLWQGARSTHATTPDRIEYVHRLLAEKPRKPARRRRWRRAPGHADRRVGRMRGNMYRLVVLGEHRRCGIGLALVRGGEEHLRRQGAHRITALSRTRTRSLRRSGSLLATRGTAR
jgi:hypothetical protein